jgi:hypothetical protein
LSKAGYHNITNIDISPSVIMQMTQLLKEGRDRIKDAARGRDIGKERGGEGDHEPYNLDCK